MQLRNFIFLFFLVFISMNACKSQDEVGSRKLIDLFEQQVELHPLKDLATKLKIDTVDSLTRLNIFLKYEYPNDGWIAIATHDFMYSIKDSELANRLLESSGSFYFSLWFDMQEGEARYKIDGFQKFIQTIKGTNWPILADYVIREIPARDFGFYDRCLELHYEATEDERFDITFLNLLEQMSLTSELSQDYLDILDYLLVCADKNKPHVKKEYIKFLKNDFYEMVNEKEVRFVEPDELESDD